jgi:hypothetical protein
MSLAIKKRKNKSPKPNRALPYTKKSPKIENRLIEGLFFGSNEIGRNSPTIPEYNRKRRHSPFHRGQSDRYDQATSALRSASTMADRCHTVSPGVWICPLDFRCEASAQGWGGFGSGDVD